MCELFIFVGIPGSGKTTLANYYSSIVNNSVHISSDAIREELYGSESIQTGGKQVFDVMRKRTINALQSGYTVYYDSYNVDSKTRKRILSWAKQYCENIYAVYVNTPLEECIRRSQLRFRTVNSDIIKNFYDRLSKPNTSEGFSKCFEVDTLWNI